MGQAGALPGNGKAPSLSCAQLLWRAGQQWSWHQGVRWIFYQMALLPKSNLSEGTGQVGPNHCSSPARWAASPGCVHTGLWGGAGLCVHACKHRVSSGAPKEMSQTSLEHQIFWCDARFAMLRSWSTDRAPHCHHKCKDEKYSKKCAH